MNKDLLEAQDIFLDSVNRICNKFGLNNIMAQLYAILYLSSKPLSLDDMTERLKISKGSASINIRALERYGAVRRIWIKGSRRDYYEAEIDIAKVIMARVQAIIQHRFTEVSAAIDATTKALTQASLSVTQEQGGEDYVAIKLFLDRMNTLGALHYKAKSILDLLNLSLLGNASADNTRSINAKEILASKYL